MLNAESWLEARIGEDANLAFRGSDEYFGAAIAKRDLVGWNILLVDGKMGRLSGRQDEYAVSLGAE
ncbi:hypothetical protein UVI_02037080 [Ustilaginoidea virens]|uniref:Uncharacterized protein n=1 Tax=Ustilaginoidea virens TaxID=1159556 RepID=A0A063C9A7_USTVR|nr:hypothetical protein UVI_02037080 [Ustilaginoidea virens]